MSDLAERSPRSGRRPKPAGVKPKKTSETSKPPGRRRRRGRRRRAPESSPLKETAPQTSEVPEDGGAKKSRRAAGGAPQPATGFGALDLSETMLAALAAADYLEPTPIQSGLIPRAMAGVDVMGQAQTGTGKTAAFGIPILEQLHPPKAHAAPQAIVLVPTRELAVQVRDECAKLASGRRVHVVAVYGGKPIRGQAEKLERGCEIVVGTPGRVLDLISRGPLVLGSIRFLVLDEADRMLDIGFRPDIEKILRRCPQARQTLLLSATIPPPVRRLAIRYMRDPEELDFSPKNPAVETIEQFYFTVDPERKFDLLVKLLQREDPTQAIVFCRTRRGTDRVQRRLQKKIRSVDTIHGDLVQKARDSVMQRFRDGKTRILVATDVVGRGIDVTRISHIINYDIPQFCDDYVHRVGRTGRMGREGVAFTFVTPEEGNELTRIEIRINRLLKRDEIAGFEPRAEEDLPNEATGTPAEEPKPVFGRRTRRHRRAL